jgi:hypothetical protein
MKKYLYALMLMCSIVVVSCDKETLQLGNMPDGGINQRVKLTLNLPKSVQPQTYAITADDENRIISIDLLAFKVENGKEFFSYYTKGILLAANGMSGQTAFYADLVKSTDDYRFVILCNAREEVQKAAVSFIEGTPKDDLLGGLVKLSSEEWAATSTNFTPFPMWGEGEVVKGVDIQTSAMTFSVLRSLAAIDVVLAQDDVNDFQITSVSVFNANNSGQIVPFPAYYDAQQKSVTAVSLPASVQSLPVQVYELNQPSTELKNEIYLFESKAAASTFVLDATGLVIGGKYKGSDQITYYRIDMVDNSGKPIALLRNHHYTVNIIKVSGAGATDKEAAWSNKPVNITVGITPWSEANLPDVNIPGVYELKVGKEIFQDDGGRKRINLDLNATYSGGWTVTSSANWITPAAGSGPAGQAQKFSFNLASNRSGASRTGTLTFKSGILSKTIKVTQAVPDFADNLPGIDVYVAKQDLPSTPTWYRAANVAERFNSMSDPLQNQVTPARTGSCAQVYGEGWRLPTFSELTSLLPYQYNQRNAMEKALREAGVTLFDRGYFYWTGAMNLNANTAAIVNANNNSGTITSTASKSSVSYRTRCVKTIPL